jgi:signal transduction histidine kinase
MSSQPYSSRRSLNAFTFSLHQPAVERLALECLAALSDHSNNLASYLTEIVTGIGHLVQSDWTIVTFGQVGKGKIIASNLGLAQERTHFSAHRVLADEVLQSGQSFIIEDSRQSQQATWLTDPYLACLGLPLPDSNGAIIGTICSFIQTPHTFTASELKIIGLFAERAATAIEHYRLTRSIAACSTDLKLSQKKLIERERLAAIGEFTSMIVHEIKNPLTTIELGLRHAQKISHSDADQQRLELALSESHRLKHLLNEILCYAKPQTLRLTTININQFLADIFLQVQDLPEATARHLSYNTSLPAVIVMGDIDKLRQVFLNLFRNAFEAIEPQETVNCSITQGEHTDWVCIAIHNGGRPIPQAILARIGQPFCSTKPSGTGLGLAISQRIILAHGGELTIASTSSGTIVRIHLPTTESCGFTDA